MSDKPFIMKDTDACATALRHWLKGLSFFNCYSMGWGGPGFVGITLTHDSNPDSDWGKLKGKAGRIICKGDDGGHAARDRAEQVIRKHLNWPAQTEAA